MEMLKTPPEMVTTASFKVPNGLMGTLARPQNLMGIRDG
tara:strand:- start:851 stop:967 length:117 start_codon:yes stop_codon:yes gene_type:complete